MVLDSSSRVSTSLFDNQWTKEKNFFKGFVANSELGLNPNVQFAVVNFGASSEITSPCGQLSSKAQVVESIDNLSKKNGATAINDALLKAREAYKGCQRLNVLPVILFLTNGREDVEQDMNLRFQTEAIIKNEALLYIGAVGSSVNISDIQRMSKYVINNSELLLYQFAKSFSELSTPNPESLFALLKTCESKPRFFCIFNLFVFFCLNIF